MREIVIDTETTGLGPLDSRRRWPRGESLRGARYILTNIAEFVRVGARYPSSTRTRPTGPRQLLQRGRGSKDASRKTPPKDRLRVGPSLSVSKCLSDSPLYEDTP
jgi:hypothetical protein